MFPTWKFFSPPLPQRTSLSLGVLMLEYPAVETFLFGLDVTDTFPFASGSKQIDVFWIVPPLLLFFMIIPGTRRGLIPTIYWSWLKIVVVNHNSRLVVDEIVIECGDSYYFSRHSPRFSVWELS